MARSKWKTPICGMTSNCGQKLFRSQQNSKERKRVKQLLAVGKYEDLPHPKKYGNEWDSPRDGKRWFGNLEHHKDPEWREYYKELMRK